MDWYTFYNAEDDEILAIGRSYECANRLGVNFKDFPSLVRKIKKGAIKKYTIVIEKVDLLNDESDFTDIKVYGEENKEIKENRVYISNRERKINVDLAMDLYNQQLNDVEMGKRLGVAKSSVRNWRERNNLPANVNRGYQKRRITA